MVKLLLEERAAAPDSRAYVNDDAIARGLAGDAAVGKYVNIEARELLEQGGSAAACGRDSHEQSGWSSTRRNSR